MRTILFSQSYALPIRDGSSVFNPVNVLSDTIREEIETAFSSLSTVKKTAAYTVLDDSLLEFINNARDAGATRITVKINYLPESQKIEISIIDNANSKDLPSEPIPYDWKKIANPSPKAQINKDGSLHAAPSGQHMALALCAYYLYRNQGKLTLRRMNKKTVLSFSSVLSPSKPADPMKLTSYQVGVMQNLNIIEAILCEILMQNPQLKNMIQTDTAYWNYNDDEIQHFLDATIKNKSQQVMKTKARLFTFFHTLNNTGGKRVAGLTIDEAKARLQLKRSVHLFQTGSPGKTETQSNFTAGKTA